MLTDPSALNALLDSLDEGVYFLDAERRITAWNRGAELITGFSRAEVLGRRCMDDILTHVDDGGCQLCRALCPAAATMSDGQPRTTEVYLHHREGHRVPVIARTTVVRDAAGSTTGVMEVFTDRTSRLALETRLHRMEELALVDPLTHLPNRRGVETTLSMRLAEMKRYGWGFGLLFADVDQFKSVNDRYGHQAGDELLAMVARNLAGNSRVSDVPGRWGGDEFVVISDNVTPESHRMLADRYRSLVASSSMPALDPSLRVTLSIGITIARPDDDMPVLFARADRLMYESKQAGGNCVTAG